MSLRLKTILGIALIEAILLAVLITTALGYMGRSINEGLVKRAGTTATLFATTTKDAVLSYDLASLDSFVSEVLKNPDMEYARVLDSQGNVFAQGGSDKPLSVEFELDLAVEDVDDGVFDTYAEIAEGGEIYGRVEIGLSVSGLQASFRQLEIWVASIAAIEMGLVALFSFILGTYLTHQLANLRYGAKKIAKGVVAGNFDDIHVKEYGSDELAEVARAFNRLVDELSEENERRKSYELQLQGLNADLEKRVERRTHELKEKNTDLTQANHELAAAQAQLVHSEKMASLGQLSAGIAHEINTPVGFVKSNLETLKEYVDGYKAVTQALIHSLNVETEEDKEAVTEQLRDLVEEHDIDFVNDDIDSLVDDSVSGMITVKEIALSLKQFSHTQEDRMHEVDVNECIKTTLGMVNSQIKYHCEVKAVYGTLPKITANNGKLCQVFTNLLVNAGHAIEGKGTIYIHTKDLGDNIEVSIMDTGKGIKNEHKSHLFEPFFTTKEPGKGTGLGLSISYGIVQEHGGDIQVHSQVGKGTKFTLTLPVFVP